MSRTVELPEDIYEELVRASRRTGKSLPELMRERAQGHTSDSSATPSIADKNHQDGLARLMQFAGALNSGDPNAGNNDCIDADLAREYSGTD